LRLALAALLGCLAVAVLAEDRYRIVEDGERSARPVALRILAHLAAGEIEQAAQLSNEPARRGEVLRDYLARVGEDEFKRVFREYALPPNRIVEEIAIGQHRLLVWRLAGAGAQLAGQYYVEVDGSFLMDDRPGPERSALQRVLRERRRERRP
jgi:hypothetical protein